MDARRGRSRPGLVVLIAAMAAVAALSSGCSSSSKAAGPLTPYRWHGVSHGTGETEILTIDGVADPARLRYSMHIHSSVGTAAGGNIVVSDSTLFEQDRAGHWCIQRLPARLTKEAIDDLTLTDLDATHWIATLDDGGTSPAIVINRFTGFEPKLGARVHRQGRSITVLFLPRPGLANLALGFTDFGRAPPVVVPNVTVQCPYTPSGD